MKTSASLLLALAFAVSAGAQTTPPASPPPVTKIILDDPAASTKAAPKKDEKKKKEEKKKEEPPAKIEGIAISRGSGFLGIEVAGGNFKLTFYDAKKKPVPPDVARAALRWKVDYQPTPERTVLNPDGKSLTSAKVVKPPYTFKLFITLIKGEGDDAATETITVDFHQ